MAQPSRKEVMVMQIAAIATATTFLEKDQVIEWTLLDGPDATTQYIIM